MLQPGTVFHDRYRLVRHIARGGMGTVYEALDLVTQRPRALKTMLPHIVSDRDLRARFASEARVTAPIRSQHIVEVFDAGIDAKSDLPFLVMELLEGEDLASLLLRRGALPAAEVLLLLSQLCLALTRTHAAQIVHRDLKPENLFIAKRDDGSPHLKVLDFGLAKVTADGKRGITTRNLGTPLYMSPEQIRGEGRIDGRTDLYSVGQIAFAMLTGRAYFADEADESTGPYGLLLWIVHGVLEPATVRARKRGIVLPMEFDAWFARATAIEASERFETAEAILRALALALGVPLVPRKSSDWDSPLESPPSQPPDPVIVVTPRMPPRRRWRRFEHWVMVSSLAVVAMLWVGSARTRGVGGHGGSATLNRTTPAGSERALSGHAVTEHALSERAGSAQTPSAHVLPVPLGSEAPVAAPSQEVVSPSALARPHQSLKNHVTTMRSGSAKASPIRLTRTPRAVPVPSELEPEDPTDYR